MTEEFLYYLWKYRVFRLDALKTTCNRDVEILYPGDRNNNQGPDFTNARIVIDGTLWAGNVEIHIKSSDYFRHHHENDPAYANLVLHVVYEADMEDARFPTLELKNRTDEYLFFRYLQFTGTKEWLACGNQITKLEAVELESWISRMTTERLEKKCKQLESIHSNTRNNWLETFYIVLARSFGFTVNNEPFEHLARKVPYTIIQKHRDQQIQVEALLFGMAGMLEEHYDESYPRQLQNEFKALRKKIDTIPLEKHIWKYHRLRPPNFPDMRIAQFAGLTGRREKLFSELFEIDVHQDLHELLDAPVSKYWNEHYRMGVPSEIKSGVAGTDSLDGIIINAIVPTLFFYGKEKRLPEYCEKAIDILEKTKEEKNSILKRWKFIGVPAGNAARSQGLIYLEQSYCSRKGCLDCAVGRKLIAS